LPWNCVIEIDGMTGIASKSPTAPATTAEHSRGRTALKLALAFGMTAGVAVLLLVLAGVFRSKVPL
jgi:hypothetical protein